MDDEFMVDGNAVAGAFREVFAHEMTSARIACEGCGEVEPIGAERAYTQAPGIVLRCRHCQAVLLVMTRRDDSHRIAFGGSRWIEVSESG
jgi:hypothetical protein